MMKTFTAFRPAIPDGTHNGDQMNPPDQPQYEGVVFTDGTCAIRWMTACRSTSIFASYAEMFRIHGHPDYGTRIVWGA